MKPSSVPLKSNMFVLSAVRNVAISHPDPQRSEEIGEDPEVATHLDLPAETKWKLKKCFDREVVSIDDFKQQEGIEDTIRLEGPTKPKAAPRKKKVLNSTASKPFVKPEKFKKAIFKQTNIGRDETYTVGRTVFDSDGEILYRISR